MSDLGNTNNQIAPVKVEKKQALQLIKWFFTFNNYKKEDIEILETKFKEICLKYVFQEEKGSCIHLQGCILLKKKMRWSEFNLTTNIHWEKCKDWEDSVKYCQKEDTRNGNVYIYGFPKPIKIIDTLYTYQKEIEDLIISTEPDGRTLHWYWESKGGVGKSSFCKYMYVKHKVVCIQGGKLADIMNIIFNLNMDETKAIIIDIPRNHKNCVSYTSIECILNGMITNTKYETGVKVFNPPHVIVFSNFYPETGEDSLSADRWDINEIKV